MTVEWVVKFLSADFSSCTTNVAGHAAGTKNSLALRYAVSYEGHVMAELGTRVNICSIQRHSSAL